MPQPAGNAAGLPDDLREARERLEEERRIFFSGPVVVFQWRNAPGWPVEYVSPNVEQVLGYSAAEFLSGAVSYAEGILAEDLERVGREVKEATESGSDNFVHESYRFRRKSGEVAWLDDYTTILRAPTGEAVLYLGYVIDVTERKLFEEEGRKLRAQLLHAQKLESLGLLAGGVAHDFNNLLTGMLGYASLARESDSLPQAHQYIERVQLAAERAADLCRQMLAYSGRGQFVVGAHDLGALIEEMAELLEVSISKRVQLRYELAPNLPLVEADVTQVRQLLMNLITNASEAIGDQDGEIVLETGMSGKQVHAIVRDNGCGMDERTRERIFDPFFTTKFEGRGLGMAAVLGILRGHGGTISVDSKPGKGTTVKVCLPVSRKAAQQRPAPGPYEANWRGRGTALVVDDEEIVRLLAGNVVESAGFELLTAVDGNEALEVFEANRSSIAVVVLDLTMPGLSGVDVYKELLRRSPTLPVVIMSGFERTDVTNRFDPVDPPCFLTKPFQPHELLAAMRRAMESRVPSRPI